MAETYIVLVPITATYALETEAKNARHAKALILQQLALNEHELFNVGEMSEYAIQWDSVTSLHVEEDETSPGSGFNTDVEAEFASMLTVTMQKTRDALKKSNASLDSAHEIIDGVYDILGRVCEAVLANNEDVKNVARAMLEVINKRKNM